MSENEKSHQKLKIVLDNLDNNFIEDYPFWKKLVDDINAGLKNFHPETPGFTYNEFCSTFKEELKSFSESHQSIDLGTIHTAVQQIMFSKINKKTEE